MFVIDEVWFFFTAWRETNLVRKLANAGASKFLNDPAEIGMVVVGETTHGRGVRHVVNWPQRTGTSSSRCKLVKGNGQQRSYADWKC